MNIYDVKTNINDISRHIKEIEMLEEKLANLKKGMKECYDDTEIDCNFTIFELKEILDDIEYRYDDLSVWEIKKMPLVQKINKLIGD